MQGGGAGGQNAKVVTRTTSAVKKGLRYHQGPAQEVSGHPLKAKDKSVRIEVRKSNEYLQKNYLYLLYSKITVHKLHKLH